MASAQTLRALMVDEIRDLYDAEKQLVKALPKLAKAVASVELRQALESHLKETRQHVVRLEKAFRLLNEKARGKHCAGIAGIIEEGGALLESDFAGPVKDVGIIAGAQRAEHYETAAYGNVIAWAKAMGRDDLANLLQETLTEEERANDALTSIGLGGLNLDAAHASSAAIGAASGRAPKPLRPFARVRAGRRAARSTRT